MRLALIVFLLSILIVPTVRGGDANSPATDLARIASEYADVLALEGTAKKEILAVARILRAKPEMAIDRTAAAGEFCLKSGLGTMVHFAFGSGYDERRCRLRIRCLGAPQGRARSRAADEIAAAWQHGTR